MKKNKDVQKELRDSAHKIWLAGLGALAVAGEEGKALFQTLVEKGEQFEAKGKKKVDKVKGKVSDAKTNVSVLLDQVQAGLDDQVASTLERLGVPSRKEIGNLAKRVEELNKAIDKMKTKPAPAPRTRRPAARKPAAKPATDAKPTE